MQITTTAEVLQLVILSKCSDVPIHGEGNIERKMMEFPCSKTEGIFYYFIEFVYRRKYSAGGLMTTHCIVHTKFLKAV